MNKEQIEPAQLEKAPEPVAEVEELNQGFNDGLLHVKWNVKPLIGMKLYTSPPEPAKDNMTPYEKLITSILKSIEHLAPGELSSKPVYQASYIDGSWCDVEQQEYEHQKNIGLSSVRVLYTSPPEVAELQKQVQELQATIRKIADQKPRLMQDQDGHEVVCYSPAFNPCKIARDAIAAAPPFTGVPNPDLDLIEKALNLAAGLSLCVTVSEYEKIKSAIAALKRLKGGV